MAYLNLKLDKIKECEDGVTEKIVDFQYTPKFITVLSYVTMLFLAYLYDQTSFIFFSILYVFILIWNLFRENDSICLSFFLGTMILGSVVTVGLGVSKISFLSFVLPIYFFKDAIKYNKMTLSWWYLPICITCIIGFIHMVTTNQGEEGTVLVWCLTLLVYIAFLLKKSLTLKMWPLTLFFCLGVDLICLLNIIKEIQLYGSSFLPENYNSSFQFGSAYAEIAGANALTFQTIFAIFLCISFIIFGNGKLKRLFCICHIILFMYVGIILVERAFFVEFAMLMILSIFMANKKGNKKNGILQIITLFLIMIGLIIEFYPYIENPYNSLVMRFDTSGIFGVRSLLYEYAINEWTNNISTFLFGEGLLYSNSISVSFMQKYTTHNIFLDYLLSVGLIGTMSFMFTTIVIIIEKLKKGRVSLVSFVPFIIFILHTFISGATRDVFIYFYLIVCILFLGIGKNVRSNDEDVNNIYADI